MNVRELPEERPDHARVDVAHPDVGSRSAEPFDAETSGEETALQAPLILADVPDEKAPVDHDCHPTIARQRPVTRDELELRLIEQRHDEAPGRNIAVDLLQLGTVEGGNAEIVFAEVDRIEKP